MSHHQPTKRLFVAPQTLLPAPKYVTPSAHQTLLPAPKYVTPSAVGNKNTLGGYTSISSQSFMSHV
ncbi:MAG: hypothetical protein DRR19_20600 [Candidatus Parabeggiatoa sp. nov. 1]|nr:MAG: hypothetical protein DRR19_20600 [Gammaproteobacteria bacterium]